MPPVSADSKVKHKVKNSLKGMNIEYVYNKRSRYSTEKYVYVEEENNPPM